MLKSIYPSKKQSIWNIFAALALSFLVFVNTRGFFTGELRFDSFNFYTIAGYASIIILFPVAVIQWLNAILRRPRIEIDESYLEYIGVFKRKKFRKDTLNTFKIQTYGEKYVFEDGDNKLIAGKYEMPEDALNEFDFPVKKLS